jgi:hypothetical protein
MENNERLSSEVINFTIDVENISESALNSIKDQLKRVERKVKEKNKPKTITISGESHSKIKKHCSLFNLNIGEWTEKVLIEELNKSNCIEKDERDYKDIQKEEMSKIEEKYINEELRKRTLIKSNKLLLSKDLKFYGYSILDGLPIYEITNKVDLFKEEFLDYLKEGGVEISLTDKKEATKNIKTSKVEDFLILDYSN